MLRFSDYIAPQVLDDVLYICDDGAGLILQLNEKPETVDQWIAIHMIPAGSKPWNTTDGLLIPMNKKRCSENCIAFLISLTDYDGKS